MQEGELKLWLPARLVVLLLPWTSGWLQIVVIWALMLGPELSLFWGYHGKMLCASGCVHIPVRIRLLPLPPVSPSVYM